MLLDKLTLREQSVSVQKVLLLTVIAYLFAVCVRVLLYVQTADIQAFWLDGEPLPIWSPDAGLYGYYAKQILAGASYPLNAEYMPGYLIAAVVSLGGLSIDSVMFWLPAFLASLIVIPVILSAHACRQTMLGFAAALIAGISANYYSRSHLGYMDTDTLNVFLPWMAAAFWIFALRNRALLFALLGAFMLLLFRLWYHSAAAILFGMLIGLLLTVLLFFRREPNAYAAVILAAAAVAPLPFGAALAALPMLGGFFYLINRKKAFGVKPYLALLLVGAVALPFLIDVQQYLERAQTYFDKPELLEIATPHGIYRFGDVLSTVAEAESAPLWQINALFSGMPYYVFPALLGFVALLLAYRAFAVTAVLLLLGAASPFAGIRFTMFAAPALALGFVYLSMLLTERFLVSGAIRKTAFSLLTVTAVGLMLFNIVRFNTRLEPFYFKQNEVKALRNFNADSTSKDLVLSWWDFGWPLWYYTGRNNTLIDNGRHHSDTFYVANELLSVNQAFVANSALYAAKVKNEDFREVIPHIVENGDIFEKFRDFSNPNTAVTAPGNAYLMLHRDMLALLPTIASAADRDPRSGRPTRQRRFYISDLREPFSGTEAVIHGDTFTLDLRNGVITGSDGAATRVNAVLVSENGKLKAAQRYDARAPMYMIIYNKTKSLYMDGSVFNSFLIQALILDLYDRKRFEKVADTGMMKLLKVR